MKVLVTGATGLVGRRVCKDLLHAGNELVIVGRATEKKFRSKFSLPCEYQSWDSLNLQGVEAVIHLAGESIAGGRWSARRKKTILDSRVQSTAKLLATLKDNWPKTFIGASAIGFYGDRGDEELNESSTAGSGFLTEVCKQWEEAYTPLESQCRLVRLRIGVVLDSTGGFLEPMESLFTSGAGGKISDGKQWMSWIHAEDLSRLILFALENPIEGTYNAVAPKPITNAHWTNAYATQLDVSSMLPAPAFALKMAMGEMSHLALDSQRVSSKKIINEGFKFKFASLEAALIDLYKWKKKPTERLFLSEQWIDKSRDDVFPFFSDAKNLEKITPPWLNFKILKQSSQQMEVGTLIDYSISLKGVPMKWRTKIANWSPPKQFADDQLKGPYKSWYHTHTFDELAGGTLMQDHVVYELPAGRLGQWVAGNYIRNDVSTIFSYRNKVIGELKF